MFENPTTKTIFAAVALSGIFYLAGQYIASNPHSVSQEADAKREISVQGKGEVSAKPDVARLTLGVQSGPQATSEQATKILTQKFEAVVQSIKAKGVAEADIKTTNLSINPVYDYSSGKQSLRGYEASESVEVKIRKLDSVGDVLSQATQQGLNQAGGITFEIDKPEALQEEAQTKAIDDAKARAERLAQSLGVKVGKVKNFTADVSSPGYPMPMFAEAKDAVGRGGDAVLPVPAGTSDIVSTVTVTFELR